jgi:alkanesulfonate monooxygenase SsuD/methylene tetrahydromethanopterin reductase-like flavin-dependent oxidoreductase (luciferase family)
MKLGVFFFGTVRMPDAGNLGPNPVDRRYGPAAVAQAYDDLSHWAKEADDLGYDSMWLTEHHFQHEGYEVTPNCVLIGALLAMQTRRIKFGAMFNIVPQWHPLKLAEDFAIGDVMTGGRLLFGVGRGTVTREALNFGTNIGSTDWDSVGLPEASAVADATNRAQFEEGMEIIRRAFTGEPFSFHGNYYHYPPIGTPDRGRFTKTLTLMPSPVHLPVEIWQPVTSDATMRYVARNGINAVLWNHGYEGVRDRWHRFAQLSDEAGRNLGRGGGRMLIANIHLGPSREQAMERVRNGHDEFHRFLLPYARKAGEKGASGFSGKAATLEESIAQRAWFVGRPEDVAADLADIRSDLGYENLTIMVHWPGLTLEEVDEQLRLFRGEVLPVLERAGVPAAAAV